MRWTILFLLTASMAIGLEIMPVSQVTPGMRGVGYTVFAGQEPEQFEFEVIGVMKNFRPQQDIILVKLHHPLLEESGIVGGMSGSPMYIDGKLVGALALGWRYSKEPIGGVVPIEYMLQLLKGEVVDTSPIAKPPLWKGDIKIEDESPLSLAPAATPIVVSGFDGRVTKLMREKLEQLGMVVVESGGAGVIGAEQGKLQAGDAVAIQLIGGDMGVGAIGTLTYCEGDKILAFGHKFYGGGRVQFPLTNAVVYTVLRNFYTPIKLASIGTPIGKVITDKQVGVAGVLGEYAETVDVQMDYKDDSQQRQYNLKMVRDPLFTPMFLPLAISNAILASGKAVGEGTIYIDMELYGEGKTLEYSNIYANTQMPIVGIDDIAEGAYLMLANPFQPISLEKIKVKIQQESTAKLAYIEKVRMGKREVHPKEAFTVKVYMRGLHGERFQEEAKIELPEDTPEGSITIYTCGGQEAQNLEYSRAPGRYKVESLDQMLERIREHYKNNELVLRVRLSKRGLTLKGWELPDVPQFLLSVFSRSNESGLGTSFAELKYRIPTDWVILGNASINVNVRKALDEEDGGNDEG